MLATRLLGAGAEPVTADARGFTAIHAAAVTDNAPLLRVLVAEHASAVDLKTPLGETALDLALRYGRDRASELLLGQGSSPSRDDALPPLHEAARMDALERAASLLAGGADVKRSIGNKTALDLAVAHGSRRVEALLRDRMR
jgi:ankyrin repeat protein